MSVSAPTIEQLARDAVEIADPETALRALTALRLELDALEADLVRRALRGGASWSRVARTLSITKQSVANHRWRITKKLGAKNSPDLVRLVLSKVRPASGARH